MLELSASVLKDQFKLLDLKTLSSDFLQLIQRAIDSKNFSSFLVHAKLSSVAQIANTP